ncbi:hypothetical protein ACTJLD_21905 [Burkholderia sp. 22088]|uniref:hypothetical protein n=1 Tax=Burkholderia sp. 22088 TaxID=3453871 RepID=UPI003F85535F
MNPLAKIGVLALACAIAFGAGVYVDRQFVLASRAKQEVKVVAGVATGVAVAQTKSKTVESAVAVTADNIDQNKVAIRHRVAAQIKRAIAPAPTPSEEAHETMRAACGGFYLDVGTVRMLNASRAGVAFHSTTSGDEAGDTAPALCFTDFVDADQELTKLYLDLAQRHDALVDSVEQFQKEQRVRLGVEETPRDK